MPTISNNAEGLSENATPTTGNTGGASGNACSTVAQGTNGTIRALAAAAIFGSRGYRMAHLAAAGDANRLMWPLADAGRVVISAYVVLDATATQVEDLMGIRHSSGNMGMLCLAADGKAVIQHAGGSQIGASKSPAAIAPGTYLVQMSAVKGADASTGTLGYAIYPLGNPTPIHTWESSAQNAGTANASHVWVGRSTGRLEAHTIDYDEIRGASLASGWLAHVAADPPTIDVDLPAPNVIDLRGSTAGDGSSLTFPAPVETTATGVTPLSIVPGVWLIDDDLTSTWTVTVEQADEQTDTDTVTVPGRLPVHANAPRIPGGTPPGTTWV